MLRKKLALCCLSFFMTLAVCFPAETPPALKAGSNGLDVSTMLADYHDAMLDPPAIKIHTGEDFTRHRLRLRHELLKAFSLEHLPERLPLDLRWSKPLDHPWCSIYRVAYQVWPGVYNDGLLYMPKKFKEKPAPIMLCPHGHWENGNADSDEQKRCLMFARLGYVTFSPTQSHYEDINLGISHQTVMVWNNMRALDFVEALPEADKTRIGSCGASGGGLQTQMLLGVEPRIKVATVVGMTSDLRKLLFPYGAHCSCNHFPGELRFIDHPEITTLNFPCPIQFLTMNDWTKGFCTERFLDIKALYAANGQEGRAECDYEPTEHEYGRTKRGKTYSWMERWLRGLDGAEPVTEPEKIQIFLPETLTKLKVSPENPQGFSGTTEYYERTRQYRPLQIKSQTQWKTWRQNRIFDLKELLGEKYVLPPMGSRNPQSVSLETGHGLIIERVNFPSEQGIFVPAIILRSENASGRLPVELILSSAGKEQMLSSSGPDSPVAKARSGELIILADIRFTGALALEKIRFSGMDGKMNRHGWERNALSWGRPLTAMAATDIRFVIDGLVQRDDVDPRRIRVTGRGAGDIAVATLFAAALDARIRGVDVDLQNRCFKKRNLSAVPFILHYGDVLQWAALLADRQLKVANIPPEAGDPQWLGGVFAAMDNISGLRLSSQ